MNEARALPQGAPPIAAAAGSADEKKPLATLRAVFSILVPAQ
ncbi:hypothetical protein [Burkholderia pseudomultivorans]|nr:hypothetical protein [Burkholderia pseudomultivorans]EGD02352.1 hypothetical protein B1M_21942 [Burkholderia sp. TJI49]